MGIRIHVLTALFKKDIKNCFINRNVALMLILPVIFVLLYKFLLSENIDPSFNLHYVLMLCSILALSVVPLNILATLISEEKEKHTLRSLMMAGVTGIEFITAKALVCLILMMSEGIMIYLLCGSPMNLFPIYLLLMFLISLAVIAFGAIVGIAARDQMAAGTLGTPLMMLLLVPPAFASMNSFFAKIAVVVPTTSLYTIFNAAVDKALTMSKDNLIALAVCLVWIIGGFIIFVRIYKRKGLDD